MGCVSYGICMAYTSSAIPSMLQPNNTSPLTVNIGDYETTWMSKFLIYFCSGGGGSKVVIEQGSETRCPEFDMGWSSTEVSKEEFRRNLGCRQDLNPFMSCSGTSLVWRCLFHCRRSPTCSTFRVAVHYSKQHRHSMNEII